MADQTTSRIVCTGEEGECEELHSRRGFPLACRVMRFASSSLLMLQISLLIVFKLGYWASEESPTLGCSIGVRSTLYVGLTGVVQNLIQKSMGIVQPY